MYVVAWHKDAEDKWAVAETEELMYEVFEEALDQVKVENIYIFEVKHDWSLEETRALYEKLIREGRIKSKQ